jgi:GAF domain-containing protein
MIWAESEETNAIERYRIFGGARSLLVAPVVLAGRFLGALELLDPVDGLPFNDEEGYALTYIGEQFAEFVAMRGVTVDPERITGSSRG